jgi:CubicO group peptidase (beta-lactamase class C family)
MPVPVQKLASSEDYLVVLDGHPSKFAPGERFAYCNSGYVLLALIAERVGGVPFHELVRERVCKPADLTDTAFLRSDDLPGRAAVGYVMVDGVARSNVFHLPVRGSGDDGICSTAADIASFWAALFDARIVSLDWVREMVRPRSELPSGSIGYGLGFWLHGAHQVFLEGADAGVSFRSAHDPRSATTCTVISNTSDGAWPIARFLNERL